ncbi:hypothetical protein vseg_017421 [Gypsophila vaccaria]
MAIIYALISIISPMQTKISRIALTTVRFMRQNSASIYASTMKNLSKKRKAELKNLPRVQQRSVNNETVITLDKKSHQLKKRVQRIKKIMASKSRRCCHADELIMIDAIQRFGLQCYFQNEISGVLRRQYESFGAKEGDHDLHDTALRFRLLRQHGYDVSADCFSKFKDKNGKFKQELEKDSKGLMSLFEASHMRIRKDHILEDAAEFSMHILRKMNNDKLSEDSIVKNTLTNPFHKSLPRLMALNSVPNVKTLMKLLHNLRDESSWIKEMQYLAKIDISMAQIKQQNEISRVSRWWKGLRLTDDLKLARIQPGKWHMWSLACLPAPNMVQQRIELTKAVSFGYIIDDIFDVYGTLEELTLFTEAVNRWSYDNITGLPDYMRVCLKNLYKATDEISDETYDKQGWKPKEFLQRAWKETCNAFLVEAKWFASGHTPSTDEYLKNGIASSGVNVLCAYLFLLLGGGNNTCRDPLTSCPHIVSLTATILRLWNDLGNPKDKNQNGSDGSFIVCFMNEHHGSSLESAREHVLTMISDTWKSLNEACLSFTPFTTDFKEAVLNLARMTHVMYCYDDSHRLPSLETHRNPRIAKTLQTLFSCC